MEYWLMIDDIDGKSGMRAARKSRMPIGPVRLSSNYVDRSCYIKSCLDGPEPIEQKSTDNIQVINDTTRFALSIDVSLYKPEELRVHLTGRDLIIEGNQEKPGGAGYIQRWTLPDEVDLDAIDISLNEFGCLSVDAAKTGLHMMRRELPIRIYSRSQQSGSDLPSLYPAGNFRI
ncbi:hypothetical protein RB195_001637 [Necator americanus]|uniref:SHSP domain-containing protein n=1 Tax=Necator americanus TaxID=51031 RepID=A0ABR1DF88_NECAM